MVLDDAHLPSEGSWSDSRPAVDNQLFFLGLGPESLRLAEASEHRTEDDSWHDAAEAARAGALLRDEGPAAAAVAAEPLLDTAHGSGLVLARLIAAYGHGRMGRLESIDIAVSGRL